MFICKLSLPTRRTTVCIEVEVVVVCAVGEGNASD